LEVKRGVLKMKTGLKGLSICLLAGFVGTLGACGAQEDDSATASTPATQLRADAADVKSTYIVSKEMASEACEILTPAMVAEIFGVAESSLRQDKIMGCIYSSNAEGDELSASLSMLMMHESEAMAAAWFENATRSLSQNEAVQLMRGATADAKQQQEIDTDTEKKVLDDMGSLISSTVGDDGIQYEPVSGIGDDARVNASEGSLWIRKNRLTFLVAAYHGPKPPAPNLLGVAIKDMAKAAMQASNDWKRETVPQRKTDSIKVAQAVVEVLPQ
jgi:hypothetical protein